VHVLYLSWPVKLLESFQWCLKYSLENNIRVLGSDKHRYSKVPSHFHFLSSMYSELSIKLSLAYCQYCSGSELARGGWMGVKYYVHCKYMYICISLVRYVTRLLICNTELWWGLLGITRYSDHASHKHHGNVLCICKSTQVLEVKLIKLGYATTR